MNAIMARRPFLISLVCTSLALDLAMPMGSNTPPGYP